MLLDRPDDQISVTRLRVRSCEPDVLAIRLRITHLFNTANLQPSRAPPSGVLIIRRLADPLPGRFTPGPAARIDSAWERAVQSKLAEIYTQAVRPGQGPVPAYAEAVWFADKSEMLACLVLDMHQGEARQRWWWQSLLRGLPDAAADGMTRLLCNEAVQVPAVLHQLSKRGHAARIVRTLSSGQVMAILAATSHAYDLPELPLERPPPAATRAPEWKPAVFVQRAAGEEGGASPAEHRTNPSAAFPMPPAGEIPWRDWLPAASPFSGLTREQACFLGVGLGLYHSPAVVRSSAFIRKLRDWWSTVPLTVQFKPAGRTVNQPADPLSPSVFPRPTTQPQQTQQPGEKVTPVTLAEQKATAARPALSAQPDGVKSVAAEHKSPSDRLPGRPADGAGQPQSGEPATYPGSTVGETRPALTFSPQNTEPSSSARQAMPTAAAEPVVSVTVNAPPPPRIQATLPPSAGLQTDSPDTAARQQDERMETAWLLANGMSTRLGGVLYLINLMVHLDLPDCFEHDWHLATRLGAWGTLEALARALLTGSDSALAEDPLWLALAELRGRQPGETLGAALPEGVPFHLPAAWLMPSDISELSDTWARVEHGSLTAGLSPSLRCWLEGVTPCLRWRLRRALSGDGADDPRQWLCHPGRLYVTSTHVDLVMSLDTVSVPIRLAGLDRDPGWLPEFGRVIKFYFE